MMEIVNQDVLGDFDFTRSDKLYSLKVPSYSVEKGIVYYQFQLRDLIYNELYYSNFRYNELRDIHQSLDKLDFQLPPFPVTHFWQKTNSNPQLIQKRRIGLQSYFARVINDPYLRGYPEVKRFIALCKKRTNTRRSLSNEKRAQNGSDRTRCHSASKSKKSEVIPKEEWKRIRRQTRPNKNLIPLKRSP